MIMEAGKSHDLLPASWRPRRVDGVSSSPCTGGESEISLTWPFCSIQAFSELDKVHPHWGGQSALVNV